MTRKKIVIFWNIITIHNSCFVFYYILQLNLLLLMAKLNFHPSSLSFRNHCYIPICCLRNIYYYQCWKGLYCLILLWKILCISNTPTPPTPINYKYCNIINVFTVSFFGKFNPFLLNKSVNCIQVNQIIINNKKTHNDPTLLKNSVHLHKINEWANQLKC